MCTGTFVFFGSQKHTYICQCLCVYVWIIHSLWSAKTVNGRQVLEVCDGVKWLAQCQWFFSCWRVFVTVELMAAWGRAHLAFPGGVKGDGLYFLQLLSTQPMVIMNSNDGRDLSKNIRCETWWHVFTPKSSSVCCPRMNLKLIKVSKVIHIVTSEE